MNEGATPRPQERGPLLRYWLPVLLWMGLIFALSSASSLPQYPDPLIELIIKKGAHATEYAILAGLVRRALVHTTALSSPSLWAFLCSVLYASSDEFHQLFVMSRQGRWLDVVIDAVGAALAVLIAHVYQRRQASGSSG